MVYCTDSIHLSRRNAVRLVKGEGVKIGKKHLHGEHPVFLTAPQKGKLETHRGSKKPMLLHFSRAQIKHHLKHGGGFWDSLKKIGSAVIDKVKPHLKDLAYKGLDKLHEISKPHIDAAIGKIAGKLGPVIGASNAGKLAQIAQSGAASITDKAKNYAHSKVSGLGLTNPGHGRGIRGGGKVGKGKGKGKGKGNKAILAIAKRAVRQGAS